MTGSTVVTTENGYTDIPEEEVVRLARNGDGYAAEYLVHKYSSFVRVRTQPYFLAGADRDDVVQEGMIGLYKAICSFDFTKNVSFRTFARVCITRQIITAVKSATRQKHIPLNGYISLNKTDVWSESAAPLAYLSAQDRLDPENIMIEREAYHGMECRIDEALSRFEAKVLMYHLKGMSYEKTAQLLGKDAKAVDNALQRIKRKLEHFLENT